MAVAKEDDVLRFFTSIMRRSGTYREEIRLAESFKAAELLGKYYGMFGGGRKSDTGDVIIVDNIAGEKNDKQA